MWLLCGATGELGGRVAERLAGHGVPSVCWCARTAVRRRALGAEHVPGDLRDPASLARAVPG